MELVQNYSINIFCVHLIFAFMLFFIINWIGKYSISIGYIQMSMLVKEDEAPAFNFLLRILSPIVYLVIISALLYKLELDNYVYNIYNVSIMYIIIRLLVNLITNRYLLMNWVRQFCYWICISLLSIFAYEYIIKTKENIIPDFSTIANELWIIILLFIYQLFNNIRLSNTKTKQRKERYISSRFKKFRKRFHHEIHEFFNNELFEALTYSIMIYEDFNRPLVIRNIEYINFKITRKPHSLGIMQVQTNKYINDSQSLLLAMNKIKKDCNEIIIQKENEYYRDCEYLLVYQIAKKYNNSDEYAKEIRAIYDYLRENIYKNSMDSFF